MRKPTTETDLLSWYRRALANTKKPEYLQDRRDMSVTLDPECGWFKRKMVRGGPWMAARIWVEIHDQPIDKETGELAGDERLLWRCTVGGVERDPVDEWFNLCQRPIDVDEFDYLTRLQRYAKNVEPREPLATPKEPIDLGRAPPPIFKRKRKRQCD